VRFKPAHQLRTLSDCLRGRPLPVAEVVEYGAGVADALRHIHESYVYGCLTPDSILLTDQGVALAPPHHAAGISPYTAPEQLQGRHDDPRSDIFTLGTILYEMTTGSRPFESRDVEDLRVSILEWDPPPIEDAPVRLARVVGTCLEKRPERRFQRAQLLAAQLKLIAASLRGSALPTESDTGHVEPRPPRKLIDAPVNGYTHPARAIPHESVLFPDDPVAERGKKRKPCPRCKSTDVRPSRPKDAWEDAAAEMGVKFRRCYRCYHRFMQVAFLRVSLDG
jgi:serine/threonine protein kinase